MSASLYDSREDSDNTPSNLRHALQCANHVLGAVERTYVRCGIATFGV